jgi:hypothetical protein
MLILSKSSDAEAAEVKKLVFDKPILIVRDVTGGPETAMGDSIDAGGHTFKVFAKLTSSE